MKQKIIFIMIIIIQACYIMPGQHRLVLHWGVKRHAIREGQYTGITLKGEAYRFQDCKDICSCGYLWAVDSIRQTSIGLSVYQYKLSYRVDTLPCDLKPKARHYTRVERIFAKGSDRKQDKIVYRIPFLDVSVYKHRTVSYDSIESFTFSRAGLNSCVDHSERVHFNYYNGPEKIKNPGAAIIILATVTEALIESSINTTLQVTEKVSTKRRQLHRYRLSDWKIKVK